MHASLFRLSDILVQASMDIHYVNDKPLGWQPIYVSSMTLERSRLYASAKNAAISDQTAPICTAIPSAKEGTKVLDTLATGLIKSIIYRFSFVENSLETSHTILCTIALNTQRISEYVYCLYYVADYVARQSYSTAIDTRLIR